MADEALRDSITAHLDSSKAKLSEVDAHMNNPEFAEIAVDLLRKMITE